MSMHLVDTHAHLTDKAYQPDLEPLLQRSRQQGVDKWITVGTSIADSQKAVDLCKLHESMHCTVGIHPHESASMQPDDLDKLRQLAEQPKACAIGEIGLDYHYDFVDRSTQNRVFSEQLALAARMALPVVVHCREAFDDCLAMLADHPAAESAVVFHCFSGDVAQAERLIDRGYFISFTGVITFKNAEQVRRAAQHAPLDRIMIETDSPYLSPEPQRKVWPNEPSLLVHTAAKLAELRNVTPQEIAEVTTQNCRLFFQIS